MMNFATVAVACLLLASPAFAGRELTQIFSAGPQTQSTSCSSFAKVSLTIKHGSCSALALTSCDAFSFAETVIKTEMQALAAEGAEAFCKPITVEASAKAIAESIVSVFTKALTVAKCKGKEAQGFGCGLAVSRGDSFSSSFASAFSKAVAAAFPNVPGVSAVCLADIEAIAVGFARVASSSMSQSCIAGNGAASTFASRLVTAVTKLIVDTFATATAEVCKIGELAAKSSCKAAVDGSSKGTSTTTDTPFQIGGSTGSGTTGGSTTGSSSAGKVKFCATPATFDCCYNKEKCFGHGLINKPFLAAASGATLFKFGARDPLCFCH